MPDAKVIGQWVEALESGEYQQAKNTLRRITPNPADHIDVDSKTVGYCCLGVLCELAAQAGVIPPGVEYGTVDSTNGVAVSYGGHESFLPQKVMAWAGLNYANPRVVYPDELAGTDHIITRESALADLNDLDGRDFKFIAQVIRQNYLNADPQPGSPA